MGLGFLVPAFLAGLAALGIPLYMHLRDRNENAPIRFPSLMFLLRLPIRTSDRRRVTDWPLLLLRALVIALGIDTASIDYGPSTDFPVHRLAVRVLRDRHEQTGLAVRHHLGDAAG